MKLSSQTVLKQANNLSLYLYLSEALYGFSSPFCGYPLYGKDCLVFDFCSQPAFVMLPICLWESSFQGAK